MCNLSWLGHQPSFLYQTLFFLAITTAIIYRYLSRIRKPDQFVQLFLLMTVIKLIAFLGYNVLMVVKDKPGAKYNVLFFLLAYFAYTLFEIVSLYRLIGSKTNN